MAVATSAVEIPVTMRIFNRWKEWLHEDRGQALVLTAVGFSMLLGCTALSIDTGVVFRAKRRLQVAADAAALAGTIDYLYNASVSSATTDAKSASSANGFTDGTNGVTVTVSVPPADGPNAGNSSYLEAIVSEPVHTYFMGVAGFKTMTVKARAVAGTPTIGPVCIWLLSPSGTGLQLKGSYDIEATGCGIYVNSNASTALSVTGNGGIVNTEFVDVVGSSVSNHATAPTSPNLNAAPRTSPWGNLTGPTPTNGGCTSTSAVTTITANVTGPGSGSAICYTNAVTISNNVTLGAGTYMFESGVTIATGATVTVSSGTIDLYGGTLNQLSNSLLNITAPTSGTYNGIAILQPSNNTNSLQVQFGSNNQTLDGYIYAPGAQVTLHDNGGGVTATGIVASSLYDNASTITIPSYDKKHPTTTPNRVVSLVE